MVRKTNQKTQDRTFRPLAEVLEDRRLLSAQTSVVGTYQVASYVGVGAQENQVAVLYGSVNGQPDTNAADFQAEIDWSDGTSAGDLVYDGISGSSAMYIVKGSHTYNQANSDIPITVTATGPQGSTASGVTADAVVSNMPSGIPGTPPSAVAASSGPEDVQVRLAGNYSVSSYAGVGFQENQVAILYATVKGQPDTTLADFNAQINFGDSASWNPADMVYDGTSGDSAMYIVKGSHTYDQATSSVPIVVYASGPDGTSTSAETASASVSSMPSGIAGAQPSPTAHSAAPEDIHVQLAGSYNTSSEAGVGFQQKQVATLYASLNGQPDTSLSDFQAQINWGDSASWDSATLSYQGNSGSSAMYEVAGTHTYSQVASSVPIVVFVNGPDGTSASTLTASATVTPNPNVVLGNLSQGQWDANQPGYNGLIPISGGAGGYQNLQASGLPTGLAATIAQNNIDITGTPTESGPFAVSMSVQDRNGVANTTSFNLAINAPVTLDALLPTQWTANQAGYNGVVQVTGGTGTYGGLVVSGLPSGLSAALSGGAVSIMGTPTESGTFTVGVSLQDTDGEMAASNYTLTIGEVQDQQQAVSGLKALIAQARKFGAGVNAALRGTINAAVQFWGGVGDWANATIGQLGALANFLNTPTAQQQQMIQDGVTKMLTIAASDPNAVNKVLAATINKNYQDFQSNPARWLGNTLPNVLTLAIPGKGAVSAAKEAAALVATEEAGVTATTLAEQVGSIQQLEAGVGESTAVGQGTIQTEQAIGARSNLNAATYRAQYADGALISQTATKAVFQEGASQVTLLGGISKVSSSGLGTLKAALRDVNAAAFETDVATASALGYYDNCVDCTTIGLSRLNQIFGSGVTKYASSLPAMARAFGSDGTLLGARLNQIPVQMQLKAVVQQITAGGYGARGGLQVASISGKFGHAFGMVNLGADGVWALDFQTQTAMKVGSTAWTGYYTQYLSKLWFVPQP